MLGELINLNLFAFFMIFARVGTALSLLPGFSAAYVPQRLRLALALAISFVMMPALSASLPVLPSSTISMALLIGGEVIVGGFLGMIGRTLIGTLQTAGTIIAYSSSMANALIQDPVSEQQSSTVSGFLLTLGLVLIFVTDLHHLMLQSIALSYTLFVPGQPLPVGDFSDHAGQLVMRSFAMGLQLASPFVILGISFYIGLGLLGRLMPALPVFFFGLPLVLSMQIWVMTVVVSGILMVFLGYFRDIYSSFLP